MSSEYISKYKQKISLYESATDPLAPLSDGQKQLILDVTHGSSERPIPAHLRDMPTETVPVLMTSIPDVDASKFKFSCKKEVSDGFK